MSGEAEEAEESAGIGGRIEDGHDLKKQNKRLLEQFVGFVESANERSAANRR
jgi:hypothetical protein